MKKICKNCNSNKTKKNWKRSGVQRFLCKSCWYAFEHGSNKNNQILNFEKIFEDFVRDDLKYRQMSQTLNLPIKSVQSILDNAPFKKIIFLTISLLQSCY